MRRHKDALTGLFVQVLAICAREGLVTAGLVAGDGTKVKASASKAASRTLEELEVSIDELQKALEAEVTAWWQEADLLDAQDEQAAADADRAVPAAAGIRKRTADRPARAEQAKEMLAQRHGDTKGAATALEQARQRAAKAAKRLAEESAAHHEKLDRYQASQQAKASGGGGRAGRPPKPVDQAAKVCAARAGQERAAAALQRALADPDKGNVPKGNTTDPHCRIVPAKTGGYMCARNLQALANDRQIILAMLLHDNPIDVGALHPLLKAGRASLDAIGVTTAIGTALSGAGYASEANFTAGCEASLLVAVHNEAATCGRDQAGGKTVPAASAGMAATMDTPEAKEACKKRQAIIEPVFGQLFERMGRNLNYRGEMAHTELHLWGTTHNLLKCFRSRQRPQPRAGHRPERCLTRPCRPTNRTFTSEQNGAPGPDSRNHDHYRSRRPPPRTTGTTDRQASTARACIRLMQRPAPRREPHPGPLSALIGYATFGLDRPLRHHLLSASRPADYESHYAQRFWRRICGPLILRSRGSGLLRAEVVA